jgi:peptidoglycan hydrolase CwlO-like protein
MCAWAMTVLGVVLAAGCVQVKEPLVNFDTSGNGGSRPDTQVRSTDSEEVQSLKQRVVELEKQLADARQKAEEEKGRRKASEKRISQLEDQIEQMQKQIKSLQEQLRKSYGG